MRISYEISHTAYLHPVKDFAKARFAPLALLDSHAIRLLICLSLFVFIGW
jgi:hypothetical protein